MATTVGFIASTIPAQVLHVSGITLFHVAAHEFDDARWWTAVASLNGMLDPWVDQLTEIRIPPTLPSGTPTGILGQ